MLPERKFRIISGLGLAAAALAATALGAVPARAAATLTTLYSFGANPPYTDGLFPVAGLIADAAGNLFGTAQFGGANGGGAVFELAKTASGYASAATVLYSFCAQPNCTDGSEPVAGLIADAAGNLFGTAQFGGANGGGAVFELAKTASGYASAATVLYSFCAQPNCTDGSEPAAGLIADAAGNLFGTTQFGGANSGGAVFELAKTASGYASAATVLVSFNGADGAQPVAGLIADAAGNLFGTAQFGGANDASAVFELAKTASGYASAATVLVSFNGADGAQPVAGLIADAAGNLFGTAQFGGANSGGAVFELAKTASGYASAPTILHSFCAQPNCADGEHPAAGLIADAAGNLFGTTKDGGVGGGGGTVFELGDSGFVPPFAGTPGTPNCHGQSVSALARQYRGLNAAAAALGFSSVPLLQNTITGYCAG